MKSLIPSALLLFTAFTLSSLNSTHAQQPGDINLSFNPSTGANSFVNSLALQPDGKVIIGVDFKISPANS